MADSGPSNALAHRDSEVIVLTAGKREGELQRQERDGGEEDETIRPPRKGNEWPALPLLDEHPPQGGAGKDRRRELNHRADMFWNQRGGRWTYPTSDRCWRCAHSNKKCDLEKTSYPCTSCKGTRHEATCANGLPKDAWHKKTFLWQQSKIKKKNENLAQRSQATAERAVAPPSPENRQALGPSPAFRSPKESPPSSSASVPQAPEASGGDSPACLQPQRLEKCPSSSSVPKFGTRNPPSSAPSVPAPRDANGFDDGYGVMSDRSVIQGAEADPNIDTPRDYIPYQVTADPGRRSADPLPPRKRPTLQSLKTAPVGQVPGSAIASRGPSQHDPPVNAGRGKTDPPHSPLPPSKRYIDNTSQVQAGEDLRSNSRREKYKKRNPAFTRRSAKAIGGIPNDFNLNNNAPFRNSLRGGAQGGPSTTIKQPIQIPQSGPASEGSKKARDKRAASPSDGEVAPGYPPEERDGDLEAQGQNTSSSSPKYARQKPRTSLSERPSPRTVLPQAGSFQPAVSGVGLFAAAPWLLDPKFTTPTPPAPPTPLPFTSEQFRDAHPAHASPTGPYIPVFQAPQTTQISVATSTALSSHGQTPDAGPPGVAYFSQPISEILEAYQELRDDLRSHRRDEEERSYNHQPSRTWLLYNAEMKSRLHGIKLMIKKLKEIAKTSDPERPSGAPAPFGVMPLSAHQGTQYFALSAPALGDHLKLQLSPIRIRLAEAGWRLAQVGAAGDPVRARALRVEQAELESRLAALEDLIPRVSGTKAATPGIGAWEDLAEERQTRGMKYGALVSNE
ncbi:hypothetical protein B2J93_7526 [Marssonina coronariae]|uniref:Uncharacterized protein n=1 Tax=Diplocarpon coronariae TaxID=2795749 RepID=A0A218Z683_9HELO|nr:hypothetical protein B2J93_7526 [Marssonina coronariae]